MCRFFSSISAVLLLSSLSSAVRVLVLCPEQCGTSDQVIDSLFNEFPTAVSYSTVAVSTELLNTIEATPFDVIFVSQAIVRWRTLALGFPGTSIVAVDDARSLTAVSTPFSDLRNVVTLTFGIERLGLVTATALCNVSSSASTFGFVGDNRGAWTRRVQAAAYTITQKDTCKVKQVASALGLAQRKATVGPASTFTADVLLAMGPAATNLVTDRCATILEIQSTLSPSPGRAYWATIDFTSAIRDIVNKTNFDFRTLTSRTYPGDLQIVGNPSKVCGNASTLLTSMTNVAKSFAKLASDTSFTFPVSAPGFTAETLATLPGTARVFGTVTMIVGDWIYGVNLNSFGKNFAIDPLTGWVDTQLANLSMSIPGSPAFTQLPVNDRSLAPANTVATGFFHGGIEANGAWSSDCGFVFVSNLDNVTVHRFPCPSCTPLAGHSATYVPNYGVFIFGGQKVSLLDNPDAMWLNLTTFTCSKVVVKSATSPMSRTGHGSALWSRTLEINGHHDSVWIAISSGSQGDQTLFDLWLYGVTTQSWIQVRTTNIGSSTDGVASVNPLLVTALDTLFIIGLSTSMFSGALGTWNHNAFPSDVGGLFFAPAFAEDTDRVDYHAIVGLISDSRGFARAFRLAIKQRSCANQVPTVSLQSCTDCPANYVQEGSICVACAARHVKPNASYRTKHQCWGGYDTAALAFFCLAIASGLLVPPMTRFSVWYIHNRAKRRRNQLVALEAAEAVASLDFDRFKYLDDMTNPTKVEDAMKHCIANLKKYRRAIPDPVLRVVDACTEQFDQPNDEGTVRSEVSTEAKTALSESKNSFRRRQTIMANSSSAHRSDQLVETLLRALRCSLRPATAAIVVFTFDDLSRWADTQRNSELAKRLARLFDTIASEISKTQGVMDNIVGDRIFASWNASVAIEDTDPLMQATKTAHAVTHNAVSERLGMVIYAGVSVGTLRCGFVGCQGDNAPPYRQFSLLGPSMTEAVNLSQAARQLRLSVLVNWNLEERLHVAFVVKFVALLKLSNQITGPFYCGEIVCTQLEKENLWDMSRLADAVSKFNHFIINGIMKGKQRNAVEASRLREEMPPSFLSALQHSTVTGKPPQEVIPKAWF